MQFLEITDALVETFAWPNKLPREISDETHGIFENGLITTPKFGDVVTAPTDYTIYVQYSFGPYAAKIRTQAQAKWWTQDDSRLLKNFPLTKTYV